MRGFRLKAARDRRRVALASPLSGVRHRAASSDVTRGARRGASLSNNDARRSVRRCAFSPLDRAAAGAQLRGKLTVGRAGGMLRAGGWCRNVAGWTAVTFDLSASVAPSNSGLVAGRVAGSRRPYRLAGARATRPEHVGSSLLIISPVTECCHLAIGD